MMRRLYAVLVSCLIFFPFIVALAQEDSVGLRHQIWFSPNKSDFLRRAGKNPVWEKVALNIDVYKFYCDAVLKSPKDVLKKQLENLSRYGVDVALECPVLFHPAISGEAFGDKDKALHALMRIKELGGSVGYLSMDEPLFYSHYHLKSRGISNWSVAELCDNVGGTVSTLIKESPDLKVGDIEPINEIDPSELKEFFECYSREVGRPLDFFHSDVRWHDEDSIILTKVFGGISKSFNIKYGVIFNSSDYNASNDAWIDSARINYDDYMLNGGIADDIIFQSWNRYPKNIISGQGKSQADLVEHVCSLKGCRQGRHR